MWRVWLLAWTVAAVTPLMAAPPVPPSGAPKQLLIHPESVTLTGPRDEQRLVVVGVWADGRSWDLTRQATITPATAGVVAIDANRVAKPTKNGSTTLTIAAAGVSKQIPVTVKDADADRPVNFMTEVEPILTKAGCNGGGCHGAALGRGGFRLSLFGFDPSFDHDQIVRSNEGRRVVVSDPERSILLAKPALAMEHGGGEKLTLGGRDYERLRLWLADGAPAPSATDPTVTRIEVFPPARVMVPGEEQQLAVTATWSDGRKEDVTAVAQFDAINDAVAAVTSMGRVTAKTAGETHVMIRFGGQAQVARVTLPFAQPTTPLTWKPNNFIDQKLGAKWAELGLRPASLCTDEEFLRRLSLDAIGTLPTPDEVKAFVADQAPDKRAKAIDRILARPEFVDWWTLKWGDLLRIERTALDEKGMWSFHNWVRGQLRDARPIDEFVRDIITAEGSTYTEGPANYYRVGRSADDWAETTSQVFLGVRIQCAKCHHHPFEKWGQDDYYGLSAFFARLGTKTSQEFGLFNRETVVFLRPTGDARHPRTGVIMKPRPFDGPATEDEFDRRKKLAEWMTAADNPYFARNIANRFWGYLMGRGLVEPLDDMRGTNPASNPELLDALAADFAAHKFDLKHLLRTILNSRAYQLSSRTEAGNAADGANTHFTRYTVRRLSAEQLADAIDLATGTREKYAGVPLGTRAVQLPDTSYKSFLMDTFGRPPRQVVCECERSSKPNIAQALTLLNGDLLQKKFADKAGRLETMASAKLSPDAAIDELFLATLSRRPNADERAKCRSWLSQAATPREGYQDLLWVLLNSREFLFNH